MYLFFGTSTISMSQRWGSEGGCLASRSYLPNSFRVDIPTSTAQPFVQIIQQTETRGALSASPVCGAWQSNGVRAPAYRSADRTGNTYDAVCLFYMLYAQKLICQKWCGMLCTGHPFVIHTKLHYRHTCLVLLLFLFLLSPCLPSKHFGDGLYIYIAQSQFTGQLLERNETKWLHNCCCAAEITIRFWLKSKFGGFLSVFPRRLCWLQAMRCKTQHNLATMYRH